VQVVVEEVVAVIPVAPVAVVVAALTECSFLLRPLAICIRSASALGGTQVLG
jgi:hypothetical protein